VRPATLLAGLALLAATACAKRGAGPVDCADFVLSPSQYNLQFTGRAGSVSQQDLTFICRAAVYGTAQVTFAQMAQAKAEHPQVIDLAQKVADEQEAMNELLTQLATNEAGVSPPDGLNASGLAMRDHLSDLSGDGFDRAYIQDVVDETKSAVADFREEATAGVTPSILRFAVNSLPALETRLQRAQTVAAGLANAAPEAR
jgi:putative membrane protein